LEPGGRIAVNVANLGRKPYRSLSADVIRILEHDLGLLLRGEIIWRKAEGASSSCAWGSFRSAANPVLRDISERVIVASKGRFDRARSVKTRRQEGLPHENTVMTEDFMALTLDVWDIAPESAKRVGHPAPFPVELPEQLIRLYTFKDDVVLDPFMGSGSTLVAASRLGRRYAGYDLDPAYVAIARGRVAAEGAPITESASAHSATVLGEGKAAKRLAEEALEAAGFEILAKDRRLPRTGVVVSVVAADAAGRRWFFDVPGPFTTYRGGLLRSETVWRALGRAAALQSSRHEEDGTAVPYVLLSTQLPKRPSEGDTALRAAGPSHVFDVIDLLSVSALERLSAYAHATTAPAPQQGFWQARDLAGLQQ
jgi:site-specific DNA-methyltransferase (adenine-specific)